MDAPLACPHCKSILSPSPPGVFHCGRCGKPHTVPDPEQLAREAAKIESDGRLLRLAGGALLAVYVAPGLLVAGWGCLTTLVYALVAIGWVAVSAHG